MLGDRKRDGSLNSREMSRTIIVGAGIAGLTHSLALARLGRPSLVLEARAEPSTDGAGIQLGPNATVILDQLGVLDAVAEQAGRPESIIVRGISDGGTIARLPLPSSGAGTDRKPAAGR